MLTQGKKEEEEEKNILNQKKKKKLCFWSFYKCLFGLLFLPEGREWCAAGIWALIDSQERQWSNQTQLRLAQSCQTQHTNVAQKVAPLLVPIKKIATTTWRSQG